MIVPEGSVKTKELTGQALSDATVNIIDLAIGDIIATTTTDADGYYQVFVPAAGPYLLEAIKDGVKLQQFTSLVEAGIDYDLGTADCATTAVALIAQAMLEDDSYPDDPADINLADIEADPDFDEVMSIMCSIIEAGEDPTVSALVQQGVEDFLNPPTPTPNPTPTPVAISAISVTGEAKVGVELTAALTPPGSTATYQWRICATVDGIYEDIGGATSTTYTPVAGDVTKFIKVVATGTGSYSGTVTSAATAAVVVTGALVVGDSYSGGKVAYIYQSGDPSYVEGETHGLIAATADASVNQMAWSDIIDTSVGTTGTAIGDGQANTATILAQSSTTPAAKICDDYTIEVGGVTYADWFLPSKDELNQLYQNKTVIGGFHVDSNSPYWSLSQFSDTVAWDVGFQTGPYSGNAKGNTCWVRAVRVF